MTLRHQSRGPNMRKLMFKTLLTLCWKYAILSVIKTMVPMFYTKIQVLQLVLRLDMVTCINQLLFKIRSGREKLHLEIWWASSHQSQMIIMKQITGLTQIWLLLLLVITKIKGQRHREPWGNLRLFQSIKRLSKLKGWVSYSILIRTQVMKMLTLVTCWKT